MLEAAWWGLVGGAALLVGAVAALVWRVPTRLLGLVMAVVQAFAAGAILTMLADTMMPESYEHAGAGVGLVTCAGFVTAFLLGRLP